MLEVSFYVLPSASLQERDNFVCKLAEKAYRQDIYCQILTASEAHSKILDDLLWTFRTPSFIPHQICSANKGGLPKQILISADEAHLPRSTTLINLSQQIPTSLSHLNRVLEIVYQEEHCLTASRERYRHYQQMGVKLSTYKL